MTGARVDYTIRAGKTNSIKRNGDQRRNPTS